MTRTKELANREPKIVFVIVLYLYVACTSLPMEASKTVQVIRRISVDIYYLNSNMDSHLICDMKARTYLVSEGRCVTDQELFNGIYTSN